MLLIIVLGLIGTLTSVCDGCDFGTLDMEDFDWSKFVGPEYWYYKMHYSNGIENGFDCLMGIIEIPVGNNSTIICGAFIISENSSVLEYGYATNWNSTGYVEFYGFLDIWNGRYYIVATDYDSYAIFKHCPFDSDELFVYVLYRTPFPDNETMERAKAELENNNINVSQLNVWSTNHCQEVELLIEGGSAA